MTQRTSAALALVCRRSCISHEASTPSNPIRSTRSLCKPYLRSFTTDVARVSRSCSSVGCCRDVGPTICAGAYRKSASRPTLFCKAPQRETNIARRDRNSRDLVLATRSETGAMSCCSANEWILESPTQNAVNLRRVSRAP